MDRFLSQNSLMRGRNRDGKKWLTTEAIQVRRQRLWETKFQQNKD